MSVDRLVVGPKAPDGAAIADFAARIGMTVEGELGDGGVLISDAAGTPLVIVDPPVQVDGEEADRVLGEERRRRYGSVWWLELHAPLAGEAAGVSLLEQLAHLIALSTEGTVTEP